MKKYSTNYSHLSKIILEMSDEQQSALLNLAQKILDGKESTDSHFQKLNKYWFVAIGILSGWILATSMLITFSKIL
ncbi:MAG: hypothetical protein PVG87_27640 [Desulfobacteraceae bacterium]|jgi:hypothetical protein